MHRFVLVLHDDDINNDIDNEIDVVVGNSADHRRRRHQKQKKHPVMLSFPFLHRHGSFRSSRSLAYLLTYIHLFIHLSLPPHENR